MPICHVTLLRRCRIFAAALLPVLGLAPGGAAAVLQPWELKRTDRLDTRRIGKATAAERSVLRIEWRAGMSDVEADRSLTEMSVKLHDLESGVAVVRAALQAMPEKQAPADPPAPEASVGPWQDIDWRLMAANLTALILVAIWWFNRRRTQAQVAAMAARLDSLARQPPPSSSDPAMARAAVADPLPEPAVEALPEPFIDIAPASAPAELEPAPPAPQPAAPAAEPAAPAPRPAAPSPQPLARAPNGDTPVFELAAPAPKADSPVSKPVAPADEPLSFELPAPAEPEFALPVAAADGDAAPSAAEGAHATDAVPSEPLVEFSLDLEPAPAAPATATGADEALIEFSTEMEHATPAALADSDDATLEFSIDVVPAPPPADAAPAPREAVAPAADAAAPSAEESLRTAEIMLSMGLEEGAAKALLDYAEANPKHAIHHMLKLLGIYRQRGLQQEFRKIAEKLRRNFNIQAAEWTIAETGDSPSLENFSRVAEHVQSLWARPTDCADYLSRLIEDNREGARAGFPQPVAEEILLLVDILRQVAADQPPA